MPDSARDIPTDSARSRVSGSAVLDTPAVHVSVTGRNCEIRPAFRAHAEELLSRVGKFDDKATHVDVELCREQNPRLSGVACHVDLTLRSKGKRIRAEAAAATPDAALDLAWQKLQLRLRRSHRRRVDHAPRRSRDPLSRMPGTVPLSVSPVEPAPRAESVPVSPEERDIFDDISAELDLRGDGPFLLRENRQSPAVMTVDEALSVMELSGEELLTFVDRDAGQPCVLHRGRGYSYGLLRLDVP